MALFKAFIIKPHTHLFLGINSVVVQVVPSIEPSQLDQDYLNYFDTRASGRMAMLPTFGFTLGK
jgi:hypothetical protein